MKALYLGAAFAAACLAMSAPASAQTYASAFAGAETMKLDAPPLSDPTIAVAGGRIGWKSASWYGVEGDLFFGLKEDQVHTNPNVDVKIDSAAFIYGVAFLPAGEKFDLIARVGYGHQAGKISGAGVAEDTNDGAGAFGVGAQYKFTATDGIRADYTHYAIPDVDSDAFTIAYVRTF